MIKLGDFSYVSAYRETFLMFDKDRDGVITLAEVRTVLMSMGKDPSETHVVSMMKKHDVDGMYADYNKT